MGKMSSLYGCLFFELLLSNKMSFVIYCNKIGRKFSVFCIFFIFQIIFQGSGNFHLWLLTALSTKLQTRFVFFKDLLKLFKSSCEVKDWIIFSIGYKKHTHTHRHHCETNTFIHSSLLSSKSKNQWYFSCISII